MFADLVVVYPPKNKAEVCVPASPPTPPPYLGAFKSATSVQADPFQLSVTPTLAVAVSPPNAKPAV